MRQSAGILLYKRVKGELRVLLVHPGGPLFARKDAGHWSIPKGEFEDEDALAAARREFHEETGFTVDGPFIPLSPVRQKGGKLVHAWGAEGDFDAARARSNHFEMEWPPHSGRMQHFPEIDRAEWFALDEAREKIKPAQAAFLDELLQKLPTR